MPGVKRSKSNTTNDTVAQKKPRQEPPNPLITASSVMLAHSWDVAKHDASCGWLMSEKLDGMRAVWNGQRLLTRQGNPIHAPAWFTLGLPDDLALDGELFAGRGRFNETVSVVRRHDAGERWGQLKYVVFDAPSASGGFETRLKAAETALSRDGSSKYACVHPHEVCKGQQQLEDELKRVEQAGGEGLMMRRAGSAYESGRSHQLLKVKSFKDDEAIVTGHQKGQGKHTGRLGALMCRSRSGKAFKIGTGFTDAQRQRPPKIGSVVAFRYFEITEAGVPRFPAFMRVREDVSATEFQ